MKKTLLTILAVFLSVYCFGQSDTIFLNNEQILCTVKEITPDAIKFAYQGEELINSIYKNAVRKIVFKSGRVQVFIEAISIKNIEGVDDYDNVSMTQLESEVKGLIKVGDVSSKAVGTTTLSNQERVKERAYRKMKINAAMMGANIVYLTNYRNEGNKAGGYYQPGSSAQTNLTGIAYTNQLPNVDEFRKIIREGMIFFTAVEEAKLLSSGSDISKSNINRKFVIKKLTTENGMIMITAELEGESKINEFRVVSFNKDFFNVYYEDRNISYNIKIKT